MNYGHTTSNPSLEIIIGSMYAGKSSELIRRMMLYCEMGYKTIYINSSLDTRSNVEFSTHNPVLKDDLLLNKNLDGLKTDKLQKVNVDNYDVICVDESQFFEDLEEIVLKWVEKMDKKVLIAGLSGDSNRNVFGQTLYLIPKSDSVTYLTPFCIRCAMATPKVVVPAPFTKSIKEVEDGKQISVGGKEKYIPVCRKCYKI